MSHAAPTGLEVAFVASTQAGDPYIYGAEASVSDVNPRAFDCSELVEWVCGRLKVAPRVPDGARTQRDHCQKHGKLIPVDLAIKTPGALLFRIARFWSGDHVGISRGGGQTIEARGRKYGTGIFSAYNRGWTHAALIPGVDYSKPFSHAPSTPPPNPWGPEVRKAGAKILHDSVVALPDLGVGSAPLHVIVLQRALNYVSGRNLAETGVYDLATGGAVADFQRFFGLGVDAKFGARTRDMLATALWSIYTGRAA